MEKILITGAAGFIGSQLIKMFCTESDRYIVSGVDRVYGEVYGRSIDTLDLKNIEEVEEYLKQNAPDIIIHCAGSADVGKSVKYPEMDYEGNVTLTHNLLFALCKAGLQNTRVVFLSSAAVYGNPLVRPVKENATLEPVSPYGLHKAMCEDVCRYFQNIYQMDIRILRIFSAYGVGLKKQIFWDMYQKYKHTGKLDMFGTGTETRDYINIEDLLNAIYLVTTSDEKIKIINVANGEETTIKEATETFAEVAGINKDAIHFLGTEKEGDPLHWKADISLLTSLGYKKRIEMREGLQKYLNWIENMEH